MWCILLQVPPATGCSPNQLLHIVLCTLDDQSCDLIAVRWLVHSGHLEDKHQIFFSDASLAYQTNAAVIPGRMISSGARIVMLQHHTVHHDSKDSSPVRASAGISGVEALAFPGGGTAPCVGSTCPWPLPFPLRYWSDSRSRADSASRTGQRTSLPRQSDARRRKIDSPQASPPLVHGSMAVAAQK